jgi:ribokinase
VAPRIAVVGSVNVDLVAYCARLPKAGETLSDARFERFFGGKGANQAAAAARLGAAVTLVACVGDDPHGREALAALRGEGVRTEHVCKRDGPTGVALIVVAADGENQIVVAPGANARLLPEDVDLEAADGVLCQLEIPADTVIAAAEAAPGFFCLNAAPAKPVAKAVLERADLVVVNRHELESLGHTERLRLVALTLGAEGAVLLERGAEVARATPPPVEVVDGTAAGDAFCASLAVGLLEGRSRQEALERACAAGALAASRAGAQASLPTAAEIESILTE